MNNIPVIAKYIIAIVAVIAIVYFFVTYSGIPIPPVIWNILFIVGLAFFCLWAINMIFYKKNTPSV